MATSIKINGTKYAYLSQGENNKVIIYKEGQVAKLFSLGDTGGREELRALQYANAINSLLVKGIACTPSSDYEWELLVMERVVPLQYRSIDMPRREEMLAKFKAQLTELHANGFAHWDVKRPANIEHGSIWDNIVVTQEGVRLIDTGNSIFPGHINECDLEEAIADDLRCLEEWGKVFLTL